ncbi:MAG: OmpA family protein [Flavobacteriia bacterium]|nr:OmpA family protein [Flavobacteriia bacterium]
MKFLILLISISLFQNFVFSQNKEIFTIYFETNSSKPQQNELKRLDDFLQRSKNPDFKIQNVSSYTDTIGSVISNEKLSLNRLNTILKIINSKGIIVESTNSIGEKYPTSIDSKTIELTKFRKVEITYYFTEQPKPIQTELADSIPKETVNLAKFRENVTSETPIVLDVKFYGGTANLLPGSEDEINALYKFLAGNKNIAALIRGHVCCMDDMSLSILRASAVYDLLIKSGIEPSRLDFKGFSNSLPVVSPEYTEEDRQKNRRVDVVFSKI